MRNDLLQGASQALVKDQDRWDAWVRQSARLSSGAAGVASQQIQHAGMLDALCREFEDANAERFAEANRPELPNVIDFFLPALSEAFIYSLYEPVARLMKARSMSIRRAAGTLRGLYLVRITLTKGQIAQYQEQKHGKLMMKFYGSEELKPYDTPEHETANLIQPTVLNPNTGSFGWWVYDVVADDTVEIFRRDIADSFLLIESL